VFVAAFVESRVAFVGRHIAFVQSPTRPTRRCASVAAPIASRRCQVGRTTTVRAVTVALAGN